LRALYQQIALELGHCRDNAHGHLVGGAGEIYAAQGNAVHPDIHTGEGFHRGAHVHGVTAQSVQFGDDQQVTSLSIRFLKPGRFMAAMLPETASAMTRLGCTRKPAAAISCVWLSVTWPAVETRQ
jgi:hypothetical protein